MFIIGVNIVNALVFIAKSEYISNISKNKDQKSKPFLFTNINLCVDNKKSSIFPFPILFSAPPSQPNSCDLSVVQHL